MRKILNVGYNGFVTVTCQYTERGPVGGVGGGWGRGAGPKALCQLRSVNLTIRLPDVVWRIAVFILFILIYHYDQTGNTSSCCKSQTKLENWKSRGLPGDWRP